MEDRVLIIGAGLCGTLLALRLAQRGYKVDVYERRPDMRGKQISAGRSINLALSDRGIQALKLVGLEKELDSLVIPMHGRMIHSLHTDLKKMKYSGREGEWINSISRGGLNKLLLSEAEKTGNINLHFDHECKDVDFEKGEVSFYNTNTDSIYTINSNLIFATDGASSSVRQSYMTQSAKMRFDFSQHYLDTGYKELEIPAAAEGGFRLDKNSLHIWPREGFMMIALPNLDGSFTVTLFLPFEGRYSFQNLNTDDEISDFFKSHFPTAYENMPDLLNDFKINPTSSLGTIKCYPWLYENKFILMGDAAHAIVPFYGQGMNASFEDVYVLDKLIDEYNNDWPKILNAYQNTRKIDTDAIADLAEDNFYEMRDATSDPVFALKRKIELHLEQNNADYFSKYSMVTFREDLDYHVAMEKGRKQDALLMEYARNIKSEVDIDYKELKLKLKEI